MLFTYLSRPTAFLQTSESALKVSSIILNFSCHFGCRTLFIRKLETIGESG